MFAVRKTQLAIAIATILAGTHGTVAIAQVGSALTVQHDSTRPIVRSARRNTVDAERFIAGPHETLELLLADGTSVTLVAGTEVTINRYRYDAAARLGELNLTVHHGAVRVIGGVLNNSSAITVDYPGGQAILDNAIATVAVDDSGTDIALLMGKSLTVKAGSATQSLDKPGSVRIVPGASPELSEASSSAYEKLALAFNPGLGSGVVPVFVTEQLEDVETATTRETEEANSAVKEQALLLTPQESVEGIRPSGCSSCGVIPGFELSGAIGSPGNAGSEGGSTAQAWVLTLTQDQSVADSAPVDGRVDYRGADGYRNTTNRMFGVRGYSQILGDELCAAGDIGCAPAVYSDPSSVQAGDRGYLRFAFGTLQSGSNVNFASTLWLSDYAHRNPDKNNNNTEIDFVTEVVADENSLGGNILAAFTFAAPSTLGPDQDGITQSLSTVADSPYPENLLSLSGAGSYNLLQAGLRRVVVEGTLTDHPDGTDETWRDFTMTDEARSILCSDECRGLQQAFNNRFEDSSAASAELLYLLPDHFMLIEGVPPASASSDQEDTRQFLYATGAVSSRQDRSVGFSIDRFLLSAGLEAFPSSAPATPGTTSGTRAFFLPDIALDVGALGLADAGAYVINPAITEAQTPNSLLLHTDFGLSNASCPNGQCSTISLTLGALSYGTAGPQFNGYTIGSTRTGADTSSISFQSGLVSTALGGGNPALACSDTAVGCSVGASTSGRAGYLVLENYTPEDQQLSGGTIHSVGAASEDDQRYALLRLATATGSLDTTTLDRAPLAGTSTGFIAGLMESDTQVDGELSLAEVRNTSTFDMSSDAAASTVSGSVALSIAALSGSAADSQSATLNLGTTGDHQSAFLDHDRYAAMAATADGTVPTSAFVSGAAVFNANGDVANPANVSFPADWAPPAYMQWGFFFGDVAVSDSTNSSPQSWHAHLVPWVRGAVSDTPLPSTGSAQYSGFAIGNVASNGQLYTAFGTYQNTWNFASRRGTGHLDLDGARYAVRTKANDATIAQFSGALLAPIAPGADANAVPSSTTAVGDLTGRFISSDTSPHGGVMGSFSIGAHRNTGDLPVPATTSTPENYVVIGVFGAERQ